MSGDKIVIDTSVIINLFNGVEGIASLISDRDLFVSVISEIEVLSYRNLSVNDKELIKGFLSDCYIIDLDNHIKELTIDIRATYKTKLPDAVIAATAIYYDLPLFTFDKGFTRISELKAVVLT